MATQTRMTIDEFLELPEEKPYLEFIKGEVHQKVAPAGKHGDIEYFLLELLNHHPATSAGKARAEVRVRYEDPDPAQSESHVPDIVYYRDRALYSAGMQHHPPALVVEIRSLGQTRDLLRDKCRYARAHGVEAAWLIDPYAGQIEIWDNDHEGMAFGRGDVVRLGELSISVADIIDAD